MTPPLYGKVYFLATPGGRKGCVRLGRVDAANIQNISSWRYYKAGLADPWSNTSEAGATCVFSAAGSDIGELSVVYNDYLQKWLMLYITDPTPPGPPPANCSCTDDLHNGPPDQVWDSHIDATTSTDLINWSAPISIKNAAGKQFWHFGAYAPMLIPGHSSGREIFFGLSEATTYTMFLTHATLNENTASDWWSVVPGRVEAENYFTAHDTSAGDSSIPPLDWYRTGDEEMMWSANEGISLVESAGEYQDFQINVKASGLYRARVKYSADVPGGCDLYVGKPDGTTYIPHRNLPSTGTKDDFRMWEPLEAFSLNAGPQMIELYVPSGTCNISYFDIYPDWSTEEYHLYSYISPFSTFADSAAWMPFGSSPYCVPPSSGIQATQATIANAVDDWQYQFFYEGAMSCALPLSNGLYSVRLKTFEPTKTASGQRRFTTDLENAIWLDNYDTFARTGDRNIAKDETVDVRVQDGTLNVDIGGLNAPIVGALEVIPADPDTYLNTVPGHIEAENFSPNGGQGQAYSDSSPENFGSYYRGEGVDIFLRQFGGYQVGLTASGEWIKYDLDVTAGGTYKVRLRYAGGSCRLRLEKPGGGIVYVPNTTLSATANSNTFATWEPPNQFTLTKGRIQMSLFFSTGGCDVDWFDIYPVNCVSTVCCATTCKNSAGDYQCGGTGCSSFSGGSDRCCSGTIASKGGACGGDPLTNAPCVLP